VLNAVTKRFPASVTLKTQLVTRVGSPPNAAMLSRTHCKAMRVSCSPKLPLLPSAVLLATLAPPRKPRAPSLVPQWGVRLGHAHNVWVRSGVDWDLCGFGFSPVVGSDDEGVGASCKDAVGRVAGGASRHE